MTVRALIVLIFAVSIRFALGSICTPEELAAESVFVPDPLNCPPEYMTKYGPTVYFAPERQGEVTWAVAERFLAAGYLIYYTHSDKDEGHPRFQFDHTNERGVFNLRKSVKLGEELFEADLRKAWRQGYTVTINSAFERVVTACATIPRSSSSHKVFFDRENASDPNYPTEAKIGKQNMGGVLGQGWYFRVDTAGNPLLVESTWLIPQTREIFQKMFERGNAISVEVWSPGPNPKLVGGTFAISVKNGLFTIYSMFHDSSEGKNIGAGTIALLTMLRELRAMGFEYADAEEVKRGSLTEVLGGYTISRAEFVSLLAQERAKGITFNNRPKSGINYFTGSELSDDELARFVGPAGTLTGLETLPSHNAPGGRGRETIIKPWLHDGQGAMTFARKMLVRLLDYPYDKRELTKLIRGSLPAIGLQNNDGQMARRLNVPLGKGMIPTSLEEQRAAANRILGALKLRAETVSPDFVAADLLEWETAKRVLKMDLSDPDDPFKVVADFTELSDATP